MKLTLLQSKLHLKSSIYLLFMLFTNLVFSQGTTCATSETLVLNGACDAATINDNSQNTPNATGCGIGTFRREGWYTFTVPSGPGLNVTITATASNRDLFLQLISSTASCTGLTQINCANANTTAGLQTETISTSLVPGIYYVKVINNGNNNDMTLSSICATSTAIPVPVNNLCANATTLPCGTANLAGTTIGTNNVAHNSGCANMSNYGVWYTFIGDGQLTTITTNPSFNIKLSVSTGTCATMTNIVCTDTSPEQATFVTVTGTTYFVYVASSGTASTTSGNFTISRTCTVAPVAPANNLCANATTLPCGTSNLAGSTINTANIVHNTGCSMSNYGVWYTFVGDGQQTTITTNPAFDIKLSVSTGSCGSLTNIVCTDSSPENAVFTTVLGTTYYIYVGYWSSGGTTTGTFTISRTCAPAPIPPVNNLCANAIVLPCSTTNLAGTTVNAANIAHNTGCTISNYGVWYKFVGDGNPTIISTNPAFDIKLSISTGTCASMTNIVCTDSSPEQASFTTILGTTYYIYVAGWSSSGTTTGTFTISRSCVTCAPPTANAATNITFTTATVNWTAPTSYIPSNGYQYAVTTSATPPASGTATTATTINMTGLTANTVYYLHVRSDCGAVNGFSTWSTISFVTGYCVATSTASTYHIDNFSTTGGTANITNNNSNFSATGYGNFTAQTVSQQQYGSVSFSTTIVGSSGFTIWVDWNDDFDFNDTGETMFLTGTYVTTATGTFTVPGTAAVGNHRMRIRANWNSTNPSSCGVITDGETEDYTFTVLTSTCPGIPSMVTASVTSTTTATIDWVAATPPPASGYHYYLTTSAVLPNSATVPTGSTAAGITTLSLTALTPNTTYYIYIRNNCGSGNVSPWTTQVSFYTGYCSSTSTSSTYHIDNFSTTGGVLNISNINSNYTATGYSLNAGVVSQLNLGNVNFSSTIVGGSSGLTIWVDWNNDLDFNDSGETMFVSATTALTHTGSFIVPSYASVGNHRMRVRTEDFTNSIDECGSIFGGETEDYTFTVLTPLPCGENPTSISVYLVSQTAATINWTAPTPAPPSGYQYYLSTSSVTPAAGAAPTGTTVTAVTSVNLTGLVSGTTYYIWIRSNCGAPDGLGIWVGPTNFTMPTCSIGSGLGTTTLACPEVTSGGLGLSGADPGPVTCGGTSTCVDLEAKYLQIGESTDYTVASIPYAPPYQFDCLRNPVSINIDDRWSSTINLPFDFCFYGYNYNQCLMSSNGVITFDLASNLPNDYSDWSFSNNLPSTNLFTNTIFGVYHDIDPKIGGQIGWELITLNTGCRALVASWHDVPMFSASCNAQLYTGMIVMYENTNVIEVYVEEKNVCGTHNSGNAVLGLQNATGTAAVVAPGRNSLDADWTTTNEAWRFTPSGASISSITWYEGSGTSGPVVGTSDIINICPATTTTYTAEIEYELCNGTYLIETDEVTVTVSGNKVWDGSTSTDWNVASNWTPSGVPLSTDCVVIPDVVNDPIVIGTNFTGLGGTLAVNANASLNVTPTNSLKIANWVNVNPSGNFVLENSANLVQINNIPNIGNINYKRTANLRRQDYVFWSSPVAAFASNAISPATNLGYQYKWNTTIGTNVNGFGNWALANETMVIGKGYAVRAPDAFSLTAFANYTSTFIGVPNNGNLSIPIIRGTWNGGGYSTVVSTTPGTNFDDNWNLVGNPYPSSIHAIKFLTLNPDIDGFINIWSHGTLPLAATADPFYANYAYNYTAADYITYNSVGASTGPLTFNGFIGAGQGFFVAMKHASATPATLIFNNTLRRDVPTGNVYNNSQYFKTNNVKDTDELEKHRIWIDLVSDAGKSTRALIGYVENATNEKDRLFDADSNEKLAFNLYSMLNEEMLLIQGKKLPFDNNDTVKIGFSIEQDGLYKIALSTLDGLFLNKEQNIFLEDKLLNATYNLKKEPYAFMGKKGITNDRFVLRYSNDSKQIETNTDLVVYDNAILNVDCKKQKIKSIQIFDTQGKLLVKKNNINNNAYQANTLNRTNALIVIKVTLADGIEEIRKFIY